MASWPPKKNAAFVFYVGLISQTDTKLLQANPTLAAGDVKVATDDAAPGNLATLPVVDADFTDRVKVSMSAGEMNGDRITVIFSDAAGAEWTDLLIDIPTSVRQIDDLAFPTVSGRSTDVLATGEIPIDFDTSIGTLAAAQIEAAALNGKGDWNIGKTGYSLTQTFPTNFADLSIVVTTGLVDITQTAADKVWSTATRTLTAFSTALALAVWDVLESAVLTASSMGLKVKNNLDAVLTARTLPTASYFDPAADTVANVTTVVTTTTNTDMRGTDSAALASVCTEVRLAELAAANLPTDVAAILSDTGTDGVVVNAAGLAADAVNEIRDAILPKKNTGFNDIPFLMVLSTDHVSAATGLTVTATRSIDGGITYAATTGTVTEAESGTYHFDASAADMNGAIVTFKFSAATADDTFVTIRTGG